MIALSNRFKEGLERLGILKSIHSNPNAMKQAFVFNKESLDATQLDSLMRITTTGRIEIVTSTKKEKKTYVYWQDFLQDLECK